MEGPMALKEFNEQLRAPTKQGQNQERRNGEGSLHEEGGGGASNHPPDSTKKTLAKDQSVPE